MNHLDFIMRYEGGNLEDHQELVDGFQAMIDDGTVWQLQGWYGRMARDLIASGDCHPAGGAKA